MVICSKWEKNLISIIFRIVCIFVMSIPPVHAAGFSIFKGNNAHHLPDPQTTEQSQFVSVHSVSIPRTAQRNVSIYTDINNVGPKKSNYQCNNPAAHRYTLRSNFSRSIQTTATRHEANQQSGRAAQITGTVTDQWGNPVARAIVIAIEEYFFEWSDWINPDNVHAYYRDTSDNNGNYSFNELYYGNFYLLVNAGDGFVSVLYPGVFSYKKATKITIDSSTTYTAHFSLNKGAEVIGAVKDSSGNGIENIRVNLYPDYNDLSIHSMFYETYTDMNGAFVFRGIPAGQWHPEVYDTSEMYLRIAWNNDEIVTQGTATAVLKDDIIMAPGGNLYGHYFTSLPDTSMHTYEKGKLFLYPQNLSVMDTAKDHFWEHYHIEIQSDSAGYYKTNAVPAGSWRVVIAPAPHFDIWDTTVWDNQPFLPSHRWYYLNNASSLETTPILTIAPYQKLNHDLQFISGGYAVLGTMKWQPDTANAIGSHTYYSIEVFIKDNNRLIKVASSYEIDSTRFVIPGLVSGENYYFRYHANGYPMQWWNGFADSSTAKDKNAQPYFFSTSSFTPLTLYLRIKPQGLHSEDDRPSAVKNLAITPISFSSFYLNWSCAPDSEAIDHYIVYRLTNPAESLFTVNEMNYWEPVNEDLLDSLLVFYETSDTFFIDTALSHNNKYMYVVAAVDSENIEGDIFLSGDTPFSDFLHQITCAQFNVHHSLNAELWHMIGVCGPDSLTVPPALSAVKLFQWDELHDSHALYDHYRPVTSVKRGCGAWLYSLQTFPLIVTDSAFNSLAEKKDSVAIQLRKGWNQISSPFPFSITPPWMVSTYETFAWDAIHKKYTSSQSLKPWNAYWIHADAACTLSLPPVPTLAVRNTLRQVSRQTLWELTVSLIGQNSSDPDNFIGAIHDSSRQPFPEISYEPPAAFDYPQLYFIDNNRLLSRQYYRTKTIPDTKLEWNVGISPSTEPMTISVQNIHTLPDIIGLFWADKTSIYDLRKNNTVDLQPHPDTYYGRIIAAAQNADLSLYTLPLHIQRTYPNPFSGSTMIEFVVPYRWSANSSTATNDRQNISLTVFNLSGRRIVSLHSGPLDPGYYRKVWDGTAASGTKVPSGVYILQLKSTTLIRSSLLFKVK